MSKIFAKLACFVVDRPLIVLVAILVFSGIATTGYVNATLVTDFFRAEKLVDGEVVAESYEVPPDVDPVSLTNSHAIVVVESDSFFTPSGATAMRSIVSELESLDHVDRILWMDRIPILNIFGLPEPLFPNQNSSQTRFDDAKQRALKHPLVAGQLLSEDARHLLLLVKFDFLFVESDDDVTSGLREACETAAKKFSDVQFDFKVTGRVPMYVTAIRNRDQNTFKYQMIAYSMIAIMAVILFRGIVAVVIVAVAPALGVFWSLGVLRFFELEGNPFNQVVVPVLISLVALTDGVHLMVQIRKRRAEGHSAKEAARIGLSEVGLACFLTSLTTAIGFASLMLSSSEIVWEFGASCVIGVTITFFAVIGTIPLACTTFLGRWLHVGHEKGVIDRNIGYIEKIVEFILRRGKIVSGIAILSTIVLLLISSTLRPDERLSNNFPDRSEAVIGLKQMDQVFGGLELGRIDVRWSEDIPSDSPVVLKVMRKIDSLLRSEGKLGSPISICNLLDALPGDGKDDDRMSMLELLPPPLKRAFYTPEYRSATANFRVRDTGIAEYGPVFERIELGLSSLSSEYPAFTFELEGNPVWRWRNLYQVVVDLALSLGTATIIIFVILAIVYRSIRIGLISLIPNLFPLAVTGTYLVFSGQMLELVSVCAFTVCLGIAVDDTIHFITRFVEENRKSQDSDQAIRIAFTSVGTSLIMTTVVLCAGFATVLWSDAREHRIFGAMGGLTIASALFGDLVFLPALLSRYVKSKNSKSND